MLLFFCIIHFLIMLSFYERNQELECKKSFPATRTAIDVAVYTVLASHTVTVLYGYC
jgi:hypothetical protein